CAPVCASAGAVALTDASVGKVSVGATDSDTSAASASGTATAATEVGDAAPGIISNLASARPIKVSISRPSAGKAAKPTDNRQPVCAATNSLRRRASVLEAVPGPLRGR